MLRLQIPDSLPLTAPGELTRAVRGGISVLDSVRRGETQYADSLGWLHVDEWAGAPVLDTVERLAADIRARADVFVLIGVGGSNNAARAAIEALRPTRGPKIFYAGNTLSAGAMQSVLAQLEGKEVYINCIAKNFETLEPGVGFRILRSYLCRRYGKAEAAGRILCTGTPGGSLEALCRREGYAFLTFPPNIGGRYTALSYVHLLPMAVAGLDVRALAAGAKAMEKHLYSCPAEENPALRYAALRSLLYQKGLSVELLSAFEPQLQYFYKWWEQLFAESEGKDNKGLLPVACSFSEQLHSLGQFIQDGPPILFETFLDVKERQSSLLIEPDGVEDGFDYLNGRDLWDINKAAFCSVRKAHSEKLPCIVLEMDRIDAEHFGQLFYFFAYACYLSGRLLGINPFDQPGVEAYKGRMFAILGK